MAHITTNSTNHTTQTVFHAHDVWMHIESSILEGTHDTDVYEQPRLVEKKPKMKIQDTNNYLVHNEAYN